MNDVNIATSIDGVDDSKVRSAMCNDVEVEKFDVIVYVGVGHKYLVHRS
jgi:hypothetical protein